MAKRFIDNSILPKAFRKLNPSLKLTWYYIWTHCDKSGVWEIDEDLFEFENRIEFDLEKFKKEFDELIEVKGEKILLKDFLRIDCGKLRENYNPHKPYLRAIAKNRLKLDPSLNQAYFKLGDGDGDGDGDKEEDEKEKEGVGEKTKKPKKPKTPKKEKPKPEIKLPWETETFKTQWQHWKIYKKKEFRFNFKSIQSEQAALTELANKSNGNEKTAIKIIHQSMAKGWKGLFELKENKNGNKSATVNRQTAEVIKSNSEGW